MWLKSEAVADLSLISGTADEASINTTLDAVSERVQCLSNHLETLTGTDSIISLDKFWLKNRSRVTVGFVDPEIAQLTLTGVQC